MSNQKKMNGSVIAIITMFFLYAMIAFVTNLGAPIGVIWKNQPGIDGNNMLGMMGNFMNFFAYLFMGIPAGKMLTKVGYKKSALIGIAVGFVGVLIQYLSSFPEGIPGFCVYLLGAFISGFSVCILNTVVNPMLNLLGGGGNRGNQLNLIGGTLNSLTGTLTPMLVGALIGQVTKSTQMADVNLVMFIAMAVFALAFVALVFIPIQDPELGKVTADTKFEHSPWSFRHCTLGVIAIFFYVGVEVGIPGALNFYLSDGTDKGAGLIENAAKIGGAVAAMYWLLMLCGRLVSGFIAGKISSRQLMLGTTTVAMILIAAAMIIPKTNTVNMPLFDIMEFKFWSAEVPLSALLLVLCGLCTSIMWASIFNLATEGLGKYTAQASGIFMMMVVGGGILPLIQNSIVGTTMGSLRISYVIVIAVLAYMIFYALIGSKNVNKDIKVD